MIVFLFGCMNKDDSNIYDSNNNVYSMNLFLDTDLDTLEVEGELYFKNDNYDLDELYITVYPNAYNPKTTGTNINFEYIKIDGEVVSYQITGEDNTAIHIDLEETLIKGQRVTISFLYLFQYWNFDRLVTYNHYYLTMFFYPFVAMFDDEGWNIEPYSFRGETYYNEIGDYYVSINVPSDYLVASSGKLVDESIKSNRKTLNIEIKDARDFSFSASSDYYVYKETIQEINFEIYAIRELSDIEVDNSFMYLENTFLMMNEEIGNYYYDHFTLEYGHFYGMESSAIIYCDEDIEEGTVVHEVIHQWFYSMIGSDQADESFLDESITTYVASFYYYFLFGVEGYDGYLNYRTSLKVELADRYLANLGVTLLRQVDDYGEYYGFLIYYHGPAMFRYYVEEFLDGDITKMMNILKVYYQEYVYKIATIDEFLDLLERESGVDNTKEWFYLQLNEFQDFDNRP